MGRRGRAVLTVGLLAVLGAACSDGGRSEIAKARAEIAAAAARATSTTPTTAAPGGATTTPTAAPLTTLARATTPGAPAETPPGLGPGARGADVVALEQRLDALRYDVGRLDDVYDQNTAYAVTAFQKVHGLARTGRATDDVLSALGTAKAPAPLVPNGGDNRVEIDIPRQVLFLYKGGTLQKVLTVSSGNNKRFCSEGWCRKAVTPGGSYGIYRQGRGWENGPLGSLYNPLYFNGGIAIHGSRSVPAQPASHGCIRIPMSAAEWFPGQVHLGMPVHVVGVDGQPPTPAVSTSPGTTAPPTATATTTPPTTTATTLVPDLLGGLLKPPT